MRDEWSDPFQTIAEQVRLDWYLGPNLSWEIPRRSSADGREILWEIKRIDGAPDAQLIQALKGMVERRQHLVVLDQAGSGKTVLSLRIQYFLSDKEISRKIFSDGAPRLVVHWSGKLPQIGVMSPALDDYLIADPLLREAARCADLTGDDERWKQRTRDTVRYAREKRRLVIIADAFDEFSEAQGELKRLFLESRSEVQWIFTGRDYAIQAEFVKGELNPKEALFAVSQFERIRINRFDERQQNAYMDRALQNLRQQKVKWREAVGGIEAANDWEPLLGFPYILRAIAGEWQYALDNNLSAPKWECPSDLFSHSSERLIERELGKPQNSKLIRAPSDVREWCRHIQRALGTVAFEMAVRHHWSEVKGSHITDTEAKVKATWKGAFRRFQDATQQHDIPTEDIWGIWKCAKEFIERFDLNNGATQGDIRADRISFYSRRVQEFYIARYLTDHASSEDFFGAHSSKSAIDWLGHQEWNLIWQFALDMPVVTGKSWCVRREGYLTFLRFLTGRPRRFRRQTELVIKAWVHASKLDNREASRKAPADKNQGFPERNLGFAETLEDALHQQFRKILNGEEGEERQGIAESLVDPESYVILGEGSNSGLLFDTGEFRMGEKKLTVEVRRFGLQKLLISNAQFQLFENPFLDCADKVMASFRGESQPAIYVSWYDAWCFSRFVGEVEVARINYQATLPTEAQWEYAARAGCDGKYFYAWVDKSDRSKGYFVVTEASLHEYVHYGKYLTGNSTATVDSKLPNLWGLCMAGNLWQWTLDAWRDELRIAEDLLVIGELGTVRVARGGSWSSLAWVCGSASRCGLDPSDRSNDDGGGLRLALIPSDIPKTAEQLSGIKIE